ncbi:MAG: tetratricopeptide repeat protein, partial [Pirellulales bacterium]|nr:tetratricopeptide repeat protein [Pirellulales bacterium]
MRIGHLVGIFVVVMLVGLPVAGQTPQAKVSPDSAITSLPVLPAEIHNAMQSRSFEQAIEVLEAALQDGQQSDQDYLLYLKGLALTELDRFDEALEVFAALERDYPQSVWKSRSRFGRANVFVQRRQYTEAGKIYRAEAERLLSRQRKDELAAIYLEFADRYYEGIPADDPSQEKKPDYQQALTYYQEAAKLRPTLSLLQKLEFRIARCLEEVDNNDQAISGYQQFLSDYAHRKPKSGLAATAEMEAEARYRLGSVQLKSQRFGAARATWLDLLAWAEALAPPPSPALEEFLAKAEYRLAHTYGLPTPNTVGDLELAVTVAQRFLAHHPDHELAPVAELEIAQGFTHHGRYGSAVEQLRRLIENPQYSESKQIPVARQMLGQAYLAQQEFDAAMGAWSEFLVEHPTDSQWPSVQKRIVDAEFAKAEHAQREKRYDEARNVWQTFLNKYPLDPRSPRVLYQFGQMKSAAAMEKHLARIKDAMDRGDSPQSIRMSDECDKLFQEAIADWRRLVSKYPGTNEASQAAYMIGTTLEDRLGRLPEALDAYKSVQGPLEQRAQQRITILTAPQLEIVTERKFRSDEKPRIKLTTRNVKEVTVKAYRVDMTDYFRKMHLASGIETLDIALIDPDSQFVHKVEDFEEYRRLDGDIEIPVDGVGVTAVTVSSEKLEATTMVVVSDLDVIVKASRNELFLFAENMRSGKPIAGASVLISDGSKVFAEELTNQDGVLQKSFDELREVSDLRVFAVRQGHVASTVNNLNGLDFAVGLSPRGYLYTDRPAYRAGQLVHIKGIVRWVDQDRFTFQAGEKFKLDIYDARGRQIQSRQVALNGYGTIASNLMLPETAPQGDYRVHLHRASGGGDDMAGALSFETGFTVTQYRLEPIEVKIELDKEVYYRGEDVSGTISVNYYYGTPLAGERLEYSFDTPGAAGETITATTDDNGQVKVKLDTQRFSESQPLALTVRYPDRGIQSSQTVYLATRGFAVGVETGRDVYISGETFDATIKATDPAGDPVGTKLNVEVFQLIHVAGKPGEKLVATHEVVTDKESGQAMQTVAIEDNGMYLIRATGTDQFDNQVSGQRRLRVSGDKDKVRLRILAQRHHYMVGETAQVRVHWREQPALALVTFEGASVLGYQLVDLKQGDNLVSVPMQSESAPNFQMTVSVMAGNQFHTASSGFQVGQHLRITLQPSRKTLQPGDDLRVKITVTDPQGNPVKAELSLAMVQTNLLNLFRDSQGVIDEFFGAGQRTTSVRQMTSCTFQYRPQTRAVSPLLIAETDRRLSLERQAGVIGDTNIQFVPELGTVIVRGSRNDVGRLVEALQEQVVGVDLNHDGLWDASHFFGDDDRDHLGRIAGAVANGQVDGIVAGDFQQHGPDPFGAPQMQMQQSMALDDRALRETRGRQAAERPRQLRLFHRGGQTFDMPAAGGANQAGQQQTGLAGNQAGVSFGVIPTQQRLQLDAYYDNQLESSAAPEHSRWLAQVAQRDFTLNALTGKGKFLAVNGRDREELEAIAAREGLQLVPKMAHAETAFWDPVIVTDAGGQAEVVITMPTRSTAWRLRAKGINATSLAGQASQDIVTKKDLFGDLKLPLAFTRGDQAEVPVEIHNSLDGKREIKVAFTIRLGEKSTTLTKSLEMDGPGIGRLSFPVQVDQSELAEFKLVVSSQEDFQDELTRNVRILPFGYPVYETASGTSSQSTVAQIQLDPSLAAVNPSLEILIGPSINRSLVESTLGGGSFPLARCGLIPNSGLERNVSDVLGGVALLKMIGDTQQSDSPEAQALSSKVSAALTSLISAQRDNGSWSWSGLPDQGEPDALLSARVMWALSAARASGFAVSNPPFEKGKAFLKSAFAAASQSHLERQTILLHAMAESRCADFALANRLYRERNRLSNSGLIHLALALAVMNHNEMARELLPLVKLSGAPGSASPRQTGNIPWMQSGVELRAMYLLAIQAITPASGKAQELAQWLIAARVGSRWPIEKANGPAIAALAAWQSKNQPGSGKYTLTITV